MDKIKKLLGIPVYYYFITYSDNTGSMKHMASFANAEIFYVVYENDSNVVISDESLSSVAKSDTSYGIALNKPLVTFRFAHPLYGNTFDYMCYSTQEKSSEEIKSFIKGELEKMSGGLLGFNLSIVDEI